MQITITINAPSWTEDNAQYWMDSMLEDIWNHNAATGDNVRLVSFFAGKQEYMSEYEGEEV